MLFHDGVYADRQDGPSWFCSDDSPTSQELTQLTQTIARRVGRYLECQGLLARDVENGYLAPDTVSQYSMAQLPDHSITYRIAVGSQAGRKVFTLQTLPASKADEFVNAAGKVSGFSLHAGVAARADERNKLERLCRYFGRPAVSEKWLLLTSNGNIRYQLRSGTTHVISEPLDFMAPLAALVPKPGVNLTRFHGVFAPNSKYRALVTPVKTLQRQQPRGKNCKTGDCQPENHHAAMTWSQCLKRVFNTDITTCKACGGAVKVMPKAFAAQRLFMAALGTLRSIFILGQNRRLAIPR